MAVSYAVDVSNNQASHQPWKSFGVHMGIVKASEGQHGRDAWFTRHMDDIARAGIKVRGAYHFAWPNQSAAAEAMNYCAAVGPYARAGMMYHILDLEPYPDGRNYQGATAAQIKAYAATWVASVKRSFPGHPVLVYTPRDNVGRHYPSNSDGYWYPAYPVQGRSFAQAAKLSRPESGPGGSPVWGWQFTSIPLDRTVVYLTPADLLATVAGTPATPSKEEDMPISAADVERIENAVWTRLWTSPTTGKPTMMGTYLAYGDAHFAATVKAVQDAANATTAGVVSAVVKALTPLIGTDADTDRVVSALKQALIDTPALKIEVTQAPATPSDGA